MDSCDWLFPHPRYTTLPLYELMVALLPLPVVDATLSASDCEIWLAAGVSIAPVDSDGVFATVAAWFLLDQILGINNLLGCFFILCGVLLSQLLPLIKKTS